MGVAMPDEYGPMRLSPQEVFELLSLGSEGERRRLLLTLLPEKEAPPLQAEYSLSSSTEAIRKSDEDAKLE